MSSGTPIIVIYIYIQQEKRIKFNNAMSYLFLLTNGVKQGGILFPLLFCIYVDDLLEKLKKSENGCVMGGIFCGALSYADEIILLSPSYRGMQNMLDISDVFAKEHFIQFNAKKSHTH